MHGPFTVMRPRLPCRQQLHSPAHTEAMDVLLPDDVDWAPPCRKATASASSRCFRARSKRIQMRDSNAHISRNLLSDGSHLNRPCEWA